MRSGTGIGVESDGVAVAVFCAGEGLRLKVCLILSPSPCFLGALMLLHQKKSCEGIGAASKAVKLREFALQPC